MDPKQVVAAVRRVVGEDRAIVPLHEPDITEGDVERVAKCAREEPVGYGYINDLEVALSRACLRDYAVCLSSGTAALHLALIAAGVEPGDEVILPDVTFIAAANAVTYCGARPTLLPNDFGATFLDSLKDYLDLTVGRNDGRYSAVTGSRVGAIVMVDLLGQPVDNGAVGSLAKSYGVPMIEDAAEALGSTWDGHPCGTFGDMAILSFNNNKIVTSGGGGAVVTDDFAAVKLIRHLASTAKMPSRFAFDHDAVGFNCRMSNLGAALALGQLQRLPDLVQRKRNLRDRYFQSFARGGFGRFGVVHHRAKPNYWLNWIHMPSLQARDETMQALDEAGLKCRAMFTPIHLQKPYADCPYIVPDDALHKPAALLHDHIICLPSGPNL